MGKCVCGGVLVVILGGRVLLGVMGGVTGVCIVLLWDASVYRMWVPSICASLCVKGRFGLFVCFAFSLYGAVSLVL